MDDGSFRLDGKVALVTGASSGLGEECARALSSAGARVVLTARRAERLQEVAAGLDGAVSAPGDLLVPEDRRNVVDAALQLTGRVDVLVNNAGWARSAPAEDEEPRAFERALGVDLTAPFELARLVAQGMRDVAGGSIVNVASVSALRAFDRYPLASYAAAKSGLVGLTRELAAQWGRHGIRVNAVAPGWFPTQMNGFLEDADQQEWIRRHTALGRAGSPAELAAVVRFLASDASSYVTGQVLAVDGGWTAF
ncbi:MAG: SDR family NAD(P)-dependent oxidoreductase [Actinomycetes bacterium]